MFQPYPKMADRSSAWALDERAARSLHGQPWVALEKLHGAHVCLVWDGEAVRVAKRRALLRPDEAFFDVRRAVGPLIPAVRSLGEALGPLRVHGELVGGHYPHDEVPPIDGLRPVQTGVWYCPDLRFVAFDLATEAGFLPWRQAVERLQEAGFLTPPVIAEARLGELQDLPLDFPTRLPAELGLPPIAENLAEGLVLRPIGSAPQMKGRPLLKRKAPRFAESRYLEAQAWGALEGDALGALEAHALGALTEARIDAACSKLGPRESLPPVQLAAELRADIWATLEAEQGAELLALDPEETALLRSVVADAVEAFLAPPTLDPERYYVELAEAWRRARPPEAPPKLHRFKRKDGPPRVTQVLSLLRGLEPQTLLDIGSGRGAFLWPLLASFPDLPVTAVDALEHRVEQIATVRAGGVERLDALHARVEALPFEDGAFDVVTILEVLEHLEDPAEAAHEVLRVAARCVIASVPSKPDDNPEHLRVFSVEALRGLFLDAGAERVQITHVLNHRIAVIQ